MACLYIQYRYTRYHRLEYLTMRMGALVFAYIMIVGLSYAQSSQEHGKPVTPITGKAIGSNNTKDDTPKNKSDSNNLPAIINLNISGKLEIASEDSDTKADAESTKWLDPISLFTFLLVVATAILGYIAWRQD